MIHLKKNYLLYKDAGCPCLNLWQGEFTRNRKQVVNRLKIPQGLSTLCFVGGVKFPQGEGSAVVHRKKNDLLYETATPDVGLCHCLWQGEFTLYCKQVVNRLKIPQGLFTLNIVGGVKFLQGEESAVVHRKKNDLLYKMPDVSIVIDFLGWSFYFIFKDPHPRFSCLHAFFSHSPPPAPSCLHALSPHTGSLPPPPRPVSLLFTCALSPHRALPPPPRPVSLLFTCSLSPTQGPPAPLYTPSRLHATYAHARAHARKRSRAHARTHAHTHTHRGSPLPPSLVHVRHKGWPRPVVYMLSLPKRVGQLLRTVGLQIQVLTVVWRCSVVPGIK